MKFAVAFLVMLVVQLNSALPPTASNCKWTGCEGKMNSGWDICNQYGAGRYTGNTNYEGCDWDTSRVECCQPLPSGTVKWSQRCYGTAYGGNYVCQSEYGSDFRATGNTMECPGVVMARYECTN